MAAHSRLRLPRAPLARFRSRLSSFALVAVSACGSGTPSSTQSNLAPADAGGSTAGNGGEGTATTSAASGNTSTASGNTSTAPAGANAPDTEVTGTDDLILTPGGVPDAGVPSSECARDTYLAERVELNLLLLIDLSGSMLAVTDDQGTTQWEAVRGAVKSFIEAPTTDGLGLSLTYFPILSPHTPCSHLDLCDDGFYCVADLCSAQLEIGGYFEPCLDNSYCLGRVQLNDGTIINDRCVAPFACKEHPLQMCLVDDNCPNGDTCDTQGDNLGICPGATSCDTADYSTAAVPLQVLPAGRDQLLASLDTQFVDQISVTPTHVALEGALEQVRAWSQAEPSKRSVIVLATDGVPEGCATSPLRTAEGQTLTLLEQAAGEGFSTFVIGVLPQDDPTIPELGQLIATETQSLSNFAQTGGTEKPFLVTANSNTTQAFLEALDGIRGSTISCDYKLPEDTQSFDLVNVQVSNGAAPEVIPKVATPADCAGPGWYYDTDETSANAEPQRVVLCPATCDQVTNSLESQVDVVLGCPTVNQVR